MVNTVESPSLNIARTIMHCSITNRINEAFPPVHNVHEIVKSNNTPGTQVFDSESGHSSESKNKHNGTPRKPPNRRSGTQYNVFKLHHLFRSPEEAKHVLYKALPTRLANSGFYKGNADPDMG